MRGQVAHPLNWILVLFAGVVFLIFFVVLIKGMVEGGEHKQAISDLTYIKDLIESSQANPNTVTRFLTKEFNTECELGLFTARMSPQTLDFSGQAIFASPALEEDILLWSHQFELGGPIMALSYLVSDSTLFVLYDPSPPFPLTYEPPLWVKDMLPNNVSIIEATRPEISAGFKGFNDIIILSDSTAPLNNLPVKEYGKQRITAVHIEPVDPSIPSKIYNGGALNFYKRSSTGRLIPAGSDSYLGKELLVGAIVSSEPGRYECSRKIAEEKARLVARINRERLEHLYDDTELGPDPDFQCLKTFNNSIYYYEFLENPDLDIKDRLDIFMLAKQQFSRDNTKLGMASCPMIY